MNCDYFSDSELGLKPRVNEIISPPVWGGIVALAHNLITTGAFGFKFPTHCPDSPVVVATDEESLQRALRAEISDLRWPLQTTEDSGSWGSQEKPYAPDTLVALDFVQFCYRAIAKPIPIPHSYHSFFAHHHLTFDAASGKEEFCTDVNRIFSRNGVAFELKPDGKISRLVAPIIAEQLAVSTFQTGDTLLNRMLEESRAKFLDPKPPIRREALERLWDCWERIKSLDNKDKKRSVGNLLDKAAVEPAFRQLLETEACALTAIGNNFHIRHTEVGKIALNDPDHVDYLFYRLFSLIYLVLKKRGNAAPWD